MNNLENELNGGTVMSIQAQVDGYVKIQFYDEMNISKKIKAENFARYFVDKKDKCNRDNTKPGSA